MALLIIIVFMMIGQIHAQADSIETTRDTAYIVGDTSFFQQEEGAVELLESTEMILKTRVVMFLVLSHNSEEPMRGVNINVMDHGVVTSDDDGLVEIEIVDRDSLFLELILKNHHLYENKFALVPDEEFSQIIVRVQDASTKDKKEDKADMVVVASREPLHARKEISVKTLKREEMQEVAAIMGDPMRAVASLPGVSTASDLSVRPYVRGGDERETRHFWNNVPLLQPYHALSMYSIYNMESVEDMKFYSGAFPVESNGSLSGVMMLNSRPAPLDSLEAMGHLSLLRGNSYVGVPIVKDRFGIYGAYQAFLYDWTLKRALDIVKLRSSGKTKKEINNYQKFVDLPNFKDLEFGFNWRIASGLHLDYTAIRAQDIFRVLDPRDAASDVQGGDLVGAAKKVDTLALVDIPNWIHGVNLKWNVNDNWVMKNTVAYQQQDWIVNFQDETTETTGDEGDGGLTLREVNDPLYKFNRKSLNFRSHNLYQLNDEHLLKFGVSYDYQLQKYDVNLMRMGYELLVKGNVDLIEALGHYNPNRFVITLEETEDRFEELLNQQVMDYKGTREQYFTSAYLSDEIEIDKKKKLMLGARVEHEYKSEETFVAPRISWKQSIDSRNELSMAAGLYSQNDFEFHYLHYNPKLKSEKSWHANVEWSHDITPYYGIEWSNYGKFYDDLAVATTVPTGTYTRDALLRGLIQHSGIESDEDFEELANRLGVSSEGLDSLVFFDQQRIIDALPEEEQQLFLEKSSERRYDYSNSGIGYVAGTELSFKYDPKPNWRGWFSVEASVSRRKDSEDGNWYNFRKHRPWGIKWHNFFDMPNDYQIALKLNVSAGQAYTGYESIKVTEDLKLSDPIFIIESKNNRRYNPYTRVDIRLSKTGTIFGHPYSSFFEIWNAFNEPNFILTDNKTNKAKWFNLNVPIPTVFLGYEVRW